MVGCLVSPVPGLILETKIADAEALKTLEDRHFAHVALLQGNATAVLALLRERHPALVEASRPLRFQLEAQRLIEMFAGAEYALLFSRPRVHSFLSAQRP